ncbi:hypothetical protein CJF42_10445 [Pseudoalteromonas sp. NBT06-2]|uniref:hypothetical protein n=1 Tax=Pseudoalteromonas sp. NBT06-2 TaxID=2025950 RepID=UPI000BA7CA84|nr:hypothetical protein [Pseudoalteromonas sp. NBT06-2]PAJ74420.1 hypothetical protein CJF42_10445 [Pseudoalteromonas sp. NBT06-2]
MILRSFVFLMLLIATGCQQEVDSKSNVTLNDKSTVEMKNNTGTLNIVAQRAMRPGQVLETSIKMKEHCKLDKFLIFLIKKKS